MSRFRWEIPILALILLVGAGLRVLYLGEALHAPSFELPAVDAAFHDYWARGLATGRWTPLGNYSDPEIYARPYFRPPGYPYFLAAGYAAFGDGYLAPRVVQMGLGLLNVVLAFLIARRWFGRAVGLILAAMMSAYWIFIYFEVEFHATVLFVFLLLAFVYLLGLWYERRALLVAIAAGVGCGLSALVRPNSLAMLLVAAGWTVWISLGSKDRSGMPTAALGLVLGAGLAIAPATIRNYVVADQFVPISSNIGINLFIGNNERASGLVATDIRDLGAFRTCFDWPAIVENLERKLDSELSDSEVSDYFAREALRFIARNPGPFLELTTRKALLFWGPAEVGQNKEVHYERQFSKVLSALPGNFPLVLSFGLLGFGMLVVDRLRNRQSETGSDPEKQRRWDISILVISLVAAYFLSVLPFFAGARYRVPVIPFLLLFAAYAVYRLVVLLRGRKFRAAGIGAVALIALYGMTTRSFTGYEPSLAKWHFDRGADYERAGDRDRASRSYERALSEDPSFFEAHYNLGFRFADQGNFDEAILHWEEAVRLRPDFPDAPYNLAKAFREKGDIARAIEQLERAVGIRPDSVKYAIELGDLLIATAEFDRAREQYETVLRLEPAHLLAMRNLAVILAKHPDVSSRDPDLAVQLAEQAVQQTSGRSATVLDALAAAYAAAGRWDDAITTARRAVGLARSSGHEELARHIQQRMESYEEARQNTHP